MARYKYLGQLNTLSLPGEKPDAEPAFEAVMHPGGEYDLPEHPLVASWEARGWLEKIEAAPAAGGKAKAPPATDPKEG